MDTVKRALNLLSMHFGNYDKESNIGKIIRVLFSNDDEFFQTAEDLKNVLDLNQASGENIDIIHGENKDLKRGSFTDEEFRERLKLETKVNNSDGDVFSIDQAGNALFQNDYKGVEETGNAEITTTLNINNQKIPNNTYKKTISAGVTNFYKMTDEAEIIDVIVSDVIFQKFVYTETGTQQTGGETGVIL